MNADIVVAVTTEYILATCILTIRNYKAKGCHLMPWLIVSKSWGLYDSMVVKQM